MKDNQEARTEGRHQFWKINMYTLSIKEQRWRVFKFYFDFLSFVVNQAG